MTDGRASLEQRARELADSGQLAIAATELIRGYGPEVYGFLVACHHGASDDADDAFSEFCEALWRTLPAFRFESSLRTWAYAIARRASLRLRRDAGRRARRHADVPGDSEAAALAAAVRSETVTHLRSQVRSGVQELRLRLPEEDQIVLLLRVDRELAWDEIARVLHGAEDAPLDVKRESARLRKRFELVKKQLYRMAVAEGLVTP